MPHNYGMTSHSNASVKIFVSLVSSVQGQILGVCAPSGFLPMNKDLKEKILNKTQKLMKTIFY